MLEMGAQWFSGRVHDCVTGSSLMGVTATKGTEVEAMTITRLCKYNVAKFNENVLRKAKTPECFCTLECNMDT